MDLAIAYPLALIECLLRTPSREDVGTGGNQQKPCSGIRKLKLDVEVASIPHSEVGRGSYSVSI